MTNSLPHKPHIRCALIALGFAAILLTFKLSQVSAQTSTPCTSPPIDISHAIFKAGDTVYTTFNNNVQGDERNQILNGLSAWTDANGRNGSGVRFDANPPPTSQATVLNFQWGNIVDKNGMIDHGTFSQLNIDAVNPDGTIRAATVTFNLAATISATNNNPYYDRNLPVPAGAPSNGYDTVLTKKTVHEVGHGMGLDDVPRSSQQPGGSVMNNGLDNCPNDTCGNQRTTVTPCDNEVVNIGYVPALPTCDPDAVAMCEINGGYVNVFTCVCQGITIYYDPYLGGGGGGGPCHDTYSCTPAYTGVWVNDEGGGHWDMEFDSWACYYEGCY